MELDNIIRLNLLYDYYKDLLTDKQKEYFELTYFDNLSLAEIANDKNISRNAVHSELTRTIELLEFYESKLELLKKSEIIKSKLDELMINDNNKESIIKSIKEVL